MASLSQVPDDGYRSEDQKKEILLAKAGSWVGEDLSTKTFDQHLELCAPANGSHLTTLFDGKILDEDPKSVCQFKKCDGLQTFDHINLRAAAGTNAEVHKSPAYLSSK
jgi:hypothetical protein